MTYEPDLQDEIIGDAEACGGPEFVELVQFEATAYVDQHYPWDGRGDEPLERHSPVRRRQRRAHQRRKCSSGRSDPPTQ